MIGQFSFALTWRTQAKRPGEGLLYDRGCGVCREEFGDKGALAMQLLMMVDVSQPRGKFGVRRGLG